MAKRQIVHIDEERCNGCGICVPSCAEGAIKIVHGKAKLQSDNLCDGLGACLGHCPQDAIKIMEREADDFDEEAVKIQISKEKNQHHTIPHKGGCPGSNMRMFDEPKKSPSATVSSGDVEINIKPQLRQWPVQLMLVPETAPYLQGCDLLITADCVPVAYANYHLDLLKGKKVVMGCPKLDDSQTYVEKLTRMIKINDLKSITVAFMEVPCCSGILRIVEKAIHDSGKRIPLERVRIGIEGEATRL